MIAGIQAPGRNDPCPCGSGLKFKKCCIGNPLGIDPAEDETIQERLLELR